MVSKLRNLILKSKAINKAIGAFVSALGASVVFTGDSVSVSNIGELKNLGLAVLVAAGVWVTRPNR